ncbi:MAG: purine-nucleoside phosphorylase [Candidatus Gastranaerophilales bacterium]|nr:purine-nucleoside phosphorylase [Candidatus Gastranaerophilales bacterium]
MQDSLNFIKSKIENIVETPEIAIILGSGLGDIADQVDGISIPYSDILGFKASLVHGHAGRLVIGKLSSRNVVVMQGRFHYYEGHSMQEVILPVRVMKLLGADKLIVTNAAGGVNLNFNPGDLMFISDHLNLTGQNPLIGKNLDELGPRFVDMSYAYNKNLLNIADKIAKNLDIKTQKGVYAALTGPVYETPAEIRMLRTLGADAIGMSTVPEVIAANHMGMKVLGISCITNMAAGILDQPLCHDEVIKTSNRVKENFIKLLKEIIKEI